ncbi:MAG: GTPase Era [Gammaproteobacteria bacterium]|nr:GTPase Era [Gammaproteobacteria bacterium]
MSDTTTGYVTILGRPNVGKSTLLNHCLDTKLSITSRKPQTTRHQLLGVLTRDLCQFLFLDTPGINAQAGRSGRSIERYMNRQALSTLNDVDVILFLVEGTGWRDGDATVLKYLKTTDVPVVCVITKIDRVKDKKRLLPLIDELAQRHPFRAIVPVAALRNEGLSLLLDVVAAQLPNGPHLYKADEITDRSTSFLVGELIREQVVRQLGAELPHRSTVIVEQFEDEESAVTIYASICIERSSQKRIVIGKGGSRLRSIGATARRNIATLLDKSVDLRLHVRVRSNWTDDRKSLANLGYR